MTSRWTQCLCADDWTGLYCDEKKEPPSIEDQSDKTRNAANVLTTSSCSRYLISFQIHNSIFEEVWVIMITSAQWFSWIYLRITTYSNNKSSTISYKCYRKIYNYIKWPRLILFTKDYLFNRHNSYSLQWFWTFNLN